MEQPKFIISAEPVCFVRSVTPLTPQIDISRTCTDEFCVPVYATISDRSVSLSDWYIAELQAQGLDKLADTIQDIRDGLLENGYDNDIIITLYDEIRRCRAFAKRLRSPFIQSCTCTSCTRVVSDSVMVGHTNLCDSCSEKLRGGCLPTCNQYPGSNGHD